MAIFRNQTHTLTLAAIVTAMVAAWWLSEEEEKQRQTEVTEVTREPEHYMRDFTITATDSDGQPYRWLRADYMASFGEEATMQKPQLEFLRQDQSRWRIDAREGHLRNENELYLSGGVTIARLDGTPEERLQVESEDLDVRLDAQTGHTDRRVTVRHGEGELHARGLDLDLKQNRLSLLDDVRGSYAP